MTHQKQEKEAELRAKEQQLEILAKNSNQLQKLDKLDNILSKLDRLDKLDKLDVLFAKLNSICIDIVSITLLTERCKLCSCRCCPGVWSSWYVASMFFVSESVSDGFEERNRRSSENYF